MEIFKIILCCLWVFYFAKIINFIVKIWQAMPIKEERSTPIYITKVIE